MSSGNATATSNALGSPPSRRCRRGWLQPPDDRCPQRSTRPTEVAAFHQHVGGNNRAASGETQNRSIVTEAHLDETRLGHTFGRDGDEFKLTDVGNARAGTLFSTGQPFVAATLPSGSLICREAQVMTGESIHVYVLVQTEVGRSGRSRTRSPARPASPAQRMSPDRTTSSSARLLPTATSLGRWSWAESRRFRDHPDVDLPGRPPLARHGDTRCLDRVLPPVLIGLGAVLVAGCAAPVAVTPVADAPRECLELRTQLPLEVSGQRIRRTSPTSPATDAWG